MAAKAKPPQEPSEVEPAAEGTGENTEGDRPGPGPEVEELRARITLLEADLASAKDKLLRARADYENLQRRSALDVSRASARAKGDLVRALLPVLEALERAERHLDELPAENRKGLELVHRELFAFFERHGLSEIEATGKAFDPSLHHAVERAETADVPEGTVLEVYQKGYTLGGEVLRHAMVKVAVAPAEKNAAPG